MYVVNKTIDELRIAQSHARANTREIERIFDLLDTKASLIFVNTELDMRPSKDAVQTMLLQKANRADVDSTLARKADLGDIKQIHVALDCKTDVTFTENLLRELETKGNHDEILNIIDTELAQKADSQSMEALQTELVSTKVDLASQI